MTTTILIATRNVHKVQEIGEILGPDFSCVTLDEFPGAPTAVEDADTFAGNAMKKVSTLASWLNEKPELLEKFSPKSAPFYIMADDSGLEVDALGGAPGVHSARFAAEDAITSRNTPDAANNAKLLRLLDGKPASRRTARFRCVLALQRIAPDGAPRESVILFDGACEGNISDKPSGGGGFGYDPLFVPDGHTQSFAELGAETKNTISHRARALQKLAEYFAAVD